MPLFARSSYTQGNPKHLLLAREARDIDTAQFREFVSRPVGDCHPAEAAERFNADLRTCPETGEPRGLLVRDDPMLPGARFVELLLPLSDEDGRPARVLAFRHVPGG